MASASVNAAADVGNGGEQYRWNRKMAVQLPKLEVMKFNGDYESWPAFWEQFNVAVHTNRDLNEASKFTYLKSVLIGSAAVTVIGLTSSGSSYYYAIDMLKEQYGNNEKIIDTYVQQLLALTPVKNRNDVVSLRKLYNTIAKITRSFKTLGISIENYGMMVKSVILRCLPFTMRSDFHKTKAGSENHDIAEPNEDAASVSNNRDISYEEQISQLLNFMKIEVESVEQAKVMDSDARNEEKVNNSKQNSFRKKDFRDKPSTAAGLFTAVKEECLFCLSKDHSASVCVSDISLQRKKDILKTHRRCFRCTKAKHSYKSCYAKVNCLKCSSKHATSMCDPNYIKQRERNSSIPNNNSKSESKLSHSGSVENQKSVNMLADGRLNNVYLQTAWAQVVSTSNEFQEYTRMIIDGGSQLTFIKESVSRQLNLPVVGSHKISIMAFGKSELSPARLCRKVSLTLKSQYNNKVTKSTAIEVPEICFDSLKAPSLNDKCINEFSIKFQLSDLLPNDKNKINGISLLIGADYYWKLVTGKTQKITDALVGVETVFGWAVHGVGKEHNSECAFSVGVNVANILHIQVEHDQSELDVQNFWNLESIGISDTKEKFKTSEFIRDRIKYQDDRYCVSLPWKDSKVDVDSNYSGALIRLKNLQKRLVQNGKLCDYENAMFEYTKSVCAERAPEVTNEDKIYFMPHRAVYREDKDTSKLRIVFDASAHAPGLPSLNDVLDQGENLVPHLLRVLMNFRFGIIGLIADIEKAFLQIEIDESDRDSLSFLWYEKPINDCDRLPEIVRYRMKRVTFGVNCSPLLLAATLRKHLTTQPENLKKTCDRLIRSFYNG